MDRTTSERLAREHPEYYRGGRIDRGRPVGRMVSVDEAEDRARRCLADDNRPRAAYWAGFTRGAGALLAAVLLVLSACGGDGDPGKGFTAVEHE